MRLGGRLRRTRRGRRLGGRGVRLRVRGAGPLPGGLPVACPAAEDIGARLGLTVTLGHDGHVQGDPEVMCSYRVDGSDDNLSAWRASLQDADRAEARYWEYYMSDGDDPDDPNAPDLYTSVELDLGDASFAGTFADAREGGYGIAGVARVRMDRTLCAVESSLTSESSQPPAGLHDTVVHLLSTLCGVGEAGGSPDAAGAWSDPCPAAADLGERVGEPVFQRRTSGSTAPCPALAPAVESALVDMLGGPLRAVTNLLH